MWNEASGFVCLVMPFHNTPRFLLIVFSILPFVAFLNRLFFLQSKNEISL